jgi:hypothetical protein
MNGHSFIVEGEKPVFISVLVSLGFVFLSLIGLWTWPEVMMVIDHLHH